LSRLLCGPDRFMRSVGVMEWVDGGGWAPTQLVLDYSEK
jgi:hypothetical protein